MAEVLLGADGRGYDLAKRLDDVGAWQAWLGDAVYAVFSPYLASLSAWEAFMSSAATQTTATVPGTLPSTKSTPMSQIRLQLRVRALLFDKAAGALFVRSSPASSPTVASLNSTYLQLHGGDIYYTYEPETRDGAPHNGFSATTAPIQSKTQSQKIRDVSSSKVNGSCFGRKTSAMVFGNALDRENVNQKDEDDLLQELWYDQFIERNNMNRYLKFPFADYEALKRSPEGMASYMKYLSAHKRRRVMFKDEQSMDVTSSGGDNGSSRYPGMAEDETFLVPEMMFPLNGVPDGIFLPTKKQEDLRKVDLYAPLDSLPHLVTPSQAMIERFGIRPEYLRVEFSRNKCRGKGGLDGNAKLLTEEQALQKAQRTVASVLTTTGLEGGSEVAIGILSEFLGNHISKLGRTLKILTDNYRTRFTSTDLIKMFLETTGFGNVAALSDYMKHNSRNSTQHGPQLHSLRIQQPTHLLSSQTHMRPTLSQMNALGGQNMTFQQQQIQLRQQQIKLLQQQQQQQPQMHVSSLQQQQMQILVRKQQQQHMHLQGQQQQQMVMQGQQTQQMQMPGRQQQSQQIQIPGQQPQQVQTPGQQQQPQQIQTQGQQQSQQMQIQGQQQQPTQAQLQGQQQTEQMQIQGQQQPQLVQMPGQRQPSQQMQMQALQQQQLQLQIRQQQQQKMQIPPQIHIQQQQQQQKIQQQQQQIQMQQHQNQQIQIKQQHQHPQQSSQIPQQQQIQAQQQNPVQQVQQQQQMQQMLQMRHRQIAAARGSGVALEKDRTMPEVKVENTTDPTMMEASFGNNVSRQQLQFRHQQSAVVSNQQQSGKQFNQYTSVQSPQLQSQGSYGARPQPVKVEGFQELFGGDSSSRQDSEERKLTSP